MTRRLRWIGLFVAAVILLAAFLRSTPDAWPYGDEAVIQIYTLQALRGALVQGPYSQYGWHHPGPLYFYLLIPTYLLSGERAIGLTLGALAINATALTLVWWVARRHTNRAVAGILTVAVAMFTWRAKELAGSIWNPHIIVLPLAALLVAGAGAGSGDRAAIVIAVALASFLMQTHASMVPICLAVLVIAATAALRRDDARRTSGRRWMALAAIAGVAAWLPAALEALHSHGHNIAALWEFFRQGNETGHSLRASFAAWASVLTASTRATVAIPWGARAMPPTTGLAFAVLCAQVAGVIAALIYARRADQRFMCLLAVEVLASSGVALWAITRIRGGIFEYQIYWLSGLGALMWGTAAAVLVTAILHHAMRPAVATILRAFAVLLVLAASVRALHDARAYAVGQANADVRRKAAAFAVRQVLSNGSVRRPVISIGQDVWVEGACVVLDVYKHHGKVAVDREWVGVFGDPLAPDGTEDALIMVGGRQLHSGLARIPGTVTLFASDGLFVDFRAAAADPRRADDRR
jgi:hypothetical protein